MPAARRVSALLGFLALAVPTSTLAAPGVELVSSDERGVTLRVTVPAHRLRPNPDGRQELIVPGFRALDVPGRPAIPIASTLVAVPVGAGVSARVLEEADWEVLADAKLSIAGRPGFQGDERLGQVPVRTPVEAIADGPWPRETVQLGQPFTLRRQRMVAVTVSPIRYDEGQGRIRVSRSVTVRLDFTGATPGAAGAAEEDRHWEPVLRGALINYEQARRWRTRGTPATRSAAPWLVSPRAQPTGRAAFDEDFPEVRIPADTTGVYLLAFPYLQASGYPSGIPIERVSVHRHEFVEGVDPPYVTIELPIEVEDLDGDGVFDDNDVILVWVQSWAERSRASGAQRVWGDGEVIYATAVGPAATGLRVPTRPGWRNTVGLTPLASYPWKGRWEKNLTYYLFPPDTLVDQFQWTEIALYYDRAGDTLRFETNDLDTTRSVSVSVTWIGRREGPHFSWAQYRKAGGPFITVAESLFWFGRISRTATATYPGSTLGPGANFVRVWGKGQNAPPNPTTNLSDNVGVDAIEATYWRRFKAILDYLPCNTGDAQGEVQILATSFSGPDMRIYDVTDSLNPVRLTVDPSHIQQVGSGYQVEFQDSVAAGSPRRYVVFRTGKIVQPSEMRPVTRRQLTARSGGDYLLVVPEAFLPAIAPLVALRQAQGLDVVVAPFESVCDEFNGGRKSSYAIKRFVRHAYENWDARFLLLFGDGSEDPRNNLRESSTDWLPLQRINGPVVIQFGFEVIPSDPWYVCMEDCNLSTSIPVLQDLFVGRLPVQTLQQAQDVVAKLVAYENFASDQDWRSEFLLSSDDAYSAETFFGGGGSQSGYCVRAGERVFRQINETISDLIQAGAGLQQAVIDTFHLDTQLGNVACANPDCSCRDLFTTQQITHSSVTPALISRLNGGRVWWNYQGHANEFVLAHEDLYINRGFQDDKDLLANDAKPFLFSAFSCHANAFGRVGDLAGGRGPSLGEEMVTLPNRGAVGSWASTGYEILPFSSVSHINVAWADAMFANPPHDEYLGEKGARVVLGETIALALARYVPTVAFNQNERGIALTYHLLGDPGTRLSIGKPQAIVTANALPVTSGQQVRLHTPGDTLRLEADLVSNVAIDSLALDRTDGAGTVTVPAADYNVTPAFPDTGAGGMGGRRYHVSYSTTLVPESHTFTFRTRDRYGVAGAFDVVFQFFTQLLLDTSVLADDDPVPPGGNLSLRVFSPSPIAPATDLALTINGVDQPFTFAPLSSDASGREWLLSWTHAPYPIDHYEVRLSVAGAGMHAHRFRVDVGGGELRVENPMNFPNPFDDETGTAFSFLLVSGLPADVQIRVFTSGGRLIYERTERGLSPGYHQLAWDGRDDEGDRLANGVYVYRMLATNGSSKAEHIGRLVKLRKPHRASSP